jgi:hypothetical protein
MNTFIKSILIALFLCCVALALSGCSASSALTGLVGSKPEITSQAGAENVKQTVGITAKQDTSSKQENTIKDSAVNGLDSSSKKKVSASSIQAESIKADKIEIRNTDGGNSWELTALFCLLSLMVGMVIGQKFGIKKGA